MLCWSSARCRWKRKLHFPCCREKIAVKSHFSTWNCIFQWRPGSNSWAPRRNQQIVPTDIKRLCYINIVISFEIRIFRHLCGNTTADCFSKWAHGLNRVCSEELLMSPSEAALLSEQFGLIGLTSQISRENQMVQFVCTGFPPPWSFIYLFFERSKQPGLL